VIYFIVNPTAGNGRAKNAVQIIEKIMRENNNTEYSVIQTDSAGDLTRISELIDYNIAESVVCVGGDGTIQEYIGLAVNKDVNFGVIPAGCGNDLVLSIPNFGSTKKFSDFEQKIRFFTEKILRREVLKTDAVSINGKDYFYNIGGTGIDIQVLKDALPLKKFLGGGAYFISLIKNVFTYKSMDLKLTVDGESESGKYTVIAICNGMFYGGNMRVCPPAVINDGFITLCKITKMPRLRIITMFPKVKPGKHEKLKEVSFVNCKSVKLEFEGKKIINLDGNLVEFQSPLTFEIIKDAVRFIV